MKRTIAILLACLLAASMSPALAGSTTLTSGNWSYSLDDDNAVLLGPADKGLESADVPATLEGHPVVKIGDNCFMQCAELKSVTFPEGITAIGTWSFGYCSKLKSVTFPESLKTIGSAAFEACASLTAVSLPLGVEQVAFRAFSACVKLSKITVNPENLFYNSRNGVLYTLDGILHTYPAGKKGTSFIIPEGTVEIADSAFNNNDYLESIEFPSSLMSIRAYAFANCGKLAAAAIPEGVTAIGTGAFMYCNSLDSFVVDPENSVYESRDGVLFDKKRSMLHSYPYGRTIADYAIPEGTLSVGDWAFVNCPVSSIIYPVSLTSVGTFAFLSCVNILSVTLPAKLAVLGNGAFSGCISLEKISLPEVLLSIGDSVFSNCTSLKELRIPDSVTSFGWMPFQGSEALTLLVGEQSCARQYAVENNIPFKVI